MHDVQQLGRRAELAVGRHPPQRLDGRIAPAHRTEGHAGAACGFAVQRLVAHVQRMLRRHRRAPDHLADPPGLAEHRHPAFVVPEQGAQLRAQHQPHVLFRIRRDDRQAHAGAVEPVQRFLDAVEQRDARRVLAHQPDEAARGQRQLPGRHADLAHDAAGIVVAQVLGLRRAHAPEAVQVGDLVEHADEKGEGIGQRAVEVENGETIGHENLVGLDSAIIGWHGRKRCYPVFSAWIVLIGLSSRKFPARILGIAARRPFLYRQQQ